MVPLTVSESLCELTLCDGTFLSASDSPVRAPAIGLTDRSGSVDQLLAVIYGPFGSRYKEYMLLLHCKSSEWCRLEFKCDRTQMIRENGHTDLWVVSHLRESGEKIQVQVLADSLISSLCYILCVTSDWVRNESRRDLQCNKPVTLTVMKNNSHCCIISFQ